MTDATISRHSPKIKDKQLSEYLDIWAEWMREHDNKQRYPSRDSIFRSTGSRAFDAMVSEMESAQAATVSAAIDDLPPVERSAVYHVKLQSVYRHLVPVERAYVQARTMLALALARRGLPMGDQ